MDVEQVAVNKISDMIAMCPHLKPYILSNDRTLLTDGHIDLHSTAVHSKESFLGRVSVQVKGRTTPKGGPRKSIAIARVDLEAYLRDSGVLYFVVFVDRGTGNRVPFYALLSPFKIQDLLEKAPTGKKSLNVPLKRLSTEVEKIEAIVGLAYQTRSESPTVSIGHEAMRKVEEITVYTDGFVTLDEPLVLRRSEMDYSVVLRTADGARAAVSGDFSILPPGYVEEVTDIEVSAGGYTFSNPTKKRIDPQTVELALSDGLRIRLQDPAIGQRGGISFSMRRSLRGRVDDIGFYLACVDEGRFAINGNLIRFEVDRVEGLSELRNYLGGLRRLEELLERLGSDPRLVDVDEITDLQEKQLNMLYRAVVQEEEIAQEFDGAGRLLQAVGPWSIELLCLPGGAQGNWRCFDLFDPALGRRFVIHSDDEEETGSATVTPYDIVDGDRMPYILNLRLDSVVAAYEGVATDPGVLIRANRMVLKLIGAADVLPQRSIEFLLGAERLNEWLIEREGSDSVHKINRWQILARRRPLSIPERLEARALKHALGADSSPASMQMQVACAVLLDDEDEALYCISRLNEADLAVMEEWPIWTVARARIKSAMLGK